jgi:hypothetical protein
VFVRVWEYEVPGERVAAFTTAYAADGAWGELFGRAAGFLGTELYRDAGRADRFRPSVHAVRPGASGTPV